MLVYGSGKDAVHAVPLKSVSGRQENPLEISAERQENTGIVKLKILGKYEATFKVTDPDA